MIKLFCYIAKTMADMDLNPANYRVIIQPLTDEAEIKLVARIDVDSRKLHREDDVVPVFRAGHISGMPFRIAAATKGFDDIIDYLPFPPHPKMKPK